jgi:hypothetical protein
MGFLKKFERASRKGRRLFSVLKTFFGRMLAALRLQAL